MDDNIIEYYDEIAKVYAFKYNWKSVDREILILFEDFLRDSSIGEILDLGCGPGKNSKFFAERGFKIRSIDLSSKMLEVARNLNQHANIDYSKDSIENFLSNMDNKKQGVLCLFSLIHLPKKESIKILRKIVRKSSRGSFILLGIQLGDFEIVQSPITKRPITIFGWRKNEIERLVKNLNFSIKFSMTRSSWAGELPREKLFLILGVN